jgi:hypothetical protein
MHMVLRAIVDSEYLRPGGAMAMYYDDFVGETRSFCYQARAWLCGIQAIQAIHGRQWPLW